MTRIIFSQILLFSSTHAHATNHGLFVMASEHLSMHASLNNVLLMSKQTFYQTFVLLCKSKASMYKKEDYATNDDPIKPSFYGMIKGTTFWKGPTSPVMNRTKQAIF